MAKIRVEISDSDYARLEALAQEQRRPPEWQAEWMLIQALAEWWEKRNLFTQPLAIDIDIEREGLPQPIERGK